MIIAARYAAIVLLLAGVEQFDESRPLRVNVWAVEAIQEQGADPYFDPELAAVHAALKDLPYNIFRKVSISEFLAPLSETTSVTINSNYTLCLTPQRVRPDGRFEMEVTVDLPPTEPGAIPAHALATKLVVQPSKLIMLEGFKTARGDLMIVFAAQR